MSDQLVAEAATYTTHNKRKMPSAGFEPAIPAIQPLQNYALDRTVTMLNYSSVHFDVCTFK